MSPFLQVVATGHPLLLVAFSHINTPVGRFAQHRLLSQLPYAKIFVNCPDNSYYLRPIPGVGDSVATIAARLKAEISALSPARVIFFGNSMGANGALLYGALLNADLTIALAPEVELGIKGGSMLRSARDPTIRDDPHALALPDLVRQQRGERLCFFGEKAIADLKGAHALRHSGAQVFGLRNAFHSLAPFLHGTVGLVPALGDLVTRGAKSAIINTASGDLWHSPDLITELYRGTCGGTHFAGFAALSRRLPRNASATTLAYCWLAYGRQLMAQGAMAQAFPFVLAAALTNPQDIEAYALLLQFREGRQHAARVDRLALISAISAHRFDPTLPYCRFLAALLIEGEATPPEIQAAIAAAELKAGVRATVALSLANLLLRHGELCRAEVAAREACERAPENVSTYLCLSAVLERQGRIREALAVIRGAIMRLSEQPALRARRTHLSARLGDDAPEPMAKFCPRQIDTNALPPVAAAVACPIVQPCG
jgi:hypothetical protein